MRCAGKQQSAHWPRAFSATMQGWRCKCEKGSRARWEQKVAACMAGAGRTGTTPAIALQNGTDLNGACTLALVHGQFAPKLVPTVILLDIILFGHQGRVHGTRSAVPIPTRIMHAPRRLVPRRSSGTDRSTFDRTEAPEKEKNVRDDVRRAAVGGWRSDDRGRREDRR